MEAQQGVAGRGVQGLRVVRGGRHAGARDAGVGSGGHLRHGRSFPAASLAVHTTLRQENCRLAAGNTIFLLLLHFCVCTNRKNCRLFNEV